MVSNERGSPVTSEKQSFSYRQSGVDIDAASGTKRNIAGLVKQTFSANVLTGIGGFGGLFEVPAGFHKPVLVSSADGVGTKLKIAFMTGRHGTVGQCLVNHCVNDILCTGAKPLYFLDYIATGALKPGIVESVVAGLAKACRENECSLIGGETAEMPDFYSEGEYDVAGTITGIVEKDAILTPDNVKAGDVLIGLASNGLHTNGYSLVRDIVFNHLKLKVESHVEELGTTVGEELLRVHRSYLTQLWPLLEDNQIKAIAHITGGGITDNLPRVIGEQCDAVINRASWGIPPVFNWLQQAGNVETEEMFHVFNMGIGLIVATSADQADHVLGKLASGNAEASIIGEISEGSGRVRYA